MSIETVRYYERRKLLSPRHVITAAQFRRWAAALFLVMKLFLKYAGIAVAVQIILCVVVWIVVELSPGHNSILGALLVYLYMPVIAVIGMLGDFKGESAMINPIIYGIPLGVLLYGVIAGLSFSYLKRDRTPS